MRNPREDGDLVDSTELSEWGDKAGHADTTLTLELDYLFPTLPPRKAESNGVG